MKTKRTMSRWSVARRLADIALRIAAGKPVRVGRTTVRVPDRVVVEQEIETGDGETELEIELAWKSTVATSRRQRSRKGRRHRRR